jgi:hypothetical protein
MLILDKKWAEVLISQPETGMGYQAATVHLSDGRRFDGVMIVEGKITIINGDPNIPFLEEEIANIIVTGC